MGPSVRGNNAGTNAQSILSLLDLLVYSNEVWVIATLEQITASSGSDPVSVDKATHNVCEREHLRHLKAECTRLGFLLFVRLSAEIYSAVVVEF
jgi:hypothetical protein